MRARYRLHHLNHSAPVAFWHASHAVQYLAGGLIGLVLGLLFLGCSNPIAPNYTCSTQPRLYTLTTGQSQLEIDHYSQATPCPVIPIN